MEISERQLVPNNVWARLCSQHPLEHLCFLRKRPCNELLHLGVSLHWILQFQFCCLGVVTDGGEGIEVSKGGELEVLHTAQAGLSRSSEKGQCLVFWTNSSTSGEAPI